MSVVGVTMVKDEADIIGWTLHHLAWQGVDRFVIADNLSTDGTRDILEATPDVTVVDDLDPAHYQGRKMTALIHEHCGPGDWVVPFDADERWTWDHGRLAELLDGAAADVIRATVWDYLPQPTDNPNEPDPYKRTCWREPHPEALPVVAFRYHPDAVIEDGNHGVQRPGIRHAGIVVRHLQYRSFEQFARKLRNGRRAMEATNLPASTGAHWRTLGSLDDQALYDEWVGLTSQPLVYDPL